MKDLKKAFAEKRCHLPLRVKFHLSWETLFPAKKIPGPQPRSFQLTQTSVGVSESRSLLDRWLDPVQGLRAGLDCDIDADGHRQFKGLTQPARRVLRGWTARLVHAQERRDELARLARDRVGKGVVRGPADVRCTGCMPQRAWADASVVSTRMHACIGIAMKLRVCACSLQQTCHPWTRTAAAEALARRARWARAGGRETTHFRIRTCSAEKDSALKGR